jgi:hypothetical protein
LWRSAQTGKHTARAFAEQCASQWTRHSSVTRPCPKPQLKDNRGKTAADMARDGTFTETAAALDAAK